jgi:poly(3-hydroxyalkanoate) depolymerase
VTTTRTVASDFVGIGRHRIRVSVSGTGRPLLLINGIGANLDMWSPLLPALDAETIVYDAPGTGESSMPVLPLTVPQMAKLAIRLLDTLGFEQVDVLGVSLGGVVAQQIALMAPDRVRRLVLASTTWGVGAIPGTWRAWATLLSPARYYVPGHYERHAPEFLGGRTGREPDLARAYGTVRRSQPPHPVGHAFQLMGGATWSTLPLLHRIRCETLVLNGDDDPLVPATNARMIAWRIPNSELRIFPGGGHLVIFDSVAEIAPVLNEFLQRP